MSMKIPMTPAGIEPTTFRFVAQHLNHCATAVPEIITQYARYEHESGKFTLNQRGSNTSHKK